MNLPDLIDEVEELAKEASEATLKVYEENFDVNYKKDDRESPLTEADEQSHKIIAAGLEVLTPDIPIISEESEDNKDYNQRKDFERFWLVDPLDGTKEFVNKNGEFTVNIGLIENGIPRAGVVVAPVPNIVYRTDGQEAHVKRGQESSELSISSVNEISNATLVHSRSHSGQKMDQFLDEIQFGDSKPKGSSLKICQVAEGEADVYLRFRPTWEWDTAAADAILRMSGGKFTEPDGNTLTYNKPSLKNPRGLLVTNSLLHKTVSSEVTDLFGDTISSES